MPLNMSELGLNLVQSISNLNWHNNCKVPSYRRIAYSVAYCLLPEFTEYIVYANLDSHEEAAHNPSVKEPSKRSELLKILLKFLIDLDL